ncbi:hypothetical protein ARC78_03055 [Stenotrophomonas pictorum JCM 9942]|uniref:Uncharacterized protein n=2 Tax=Stenotrophomonas pictorum TaxID=86184 RepID=A0A0R0AJB4_9GAMM|nr:hypothetical protein [Stenotrophomonas pictorum]KRG45180.1 hypothetical protein ARC78_03055 [Stenotrophomonas pictorum JCM 9942]
MSDFIATFPWTLPLQRLQQRDPVLAPLALFDADGALNAHGQALEQLLLAGQALAQREADVALVADELRRYQKFAPPGRPSLQIVQLRRQQSAVQQAQRVARQAFIRQADAFARAMSLAVPAKLGTLVIVERWLQAHLR